MESLENYLYDMMLNYKNISGIGAKQKAEIIGVVADGMKWLAENHKTATTHAFDCKEYSISKQIYDIIHEEINDV